MTISQNPSFDTFQGLFNEAEFVYRHLGSLIAILFITPLTKDCHDYLSKPIV
ncbi:hypothetical protein [Psychrobacter sp. B29-1]|uniref:hypothetical protein n=1 Tax=Psychrobacter sp. B29-1 TaxID=1867800 RepID=UPI000A7183B6|nr:hypothetical protein [Psychrobacter sp. B29-1]